MVLQLKSQELQAEKDLAENRLARVKLELSKITDKNKQLLDQLSSKSVLSYPSDLHENNF